MNKVFISVGHGGQDPGAVANGLVEKNINLVMALAMRDELLRNGIKVELSRVTDVNDTLTQKANKCNAYAPELAVEIHNNAGGGNGFEVYYQTNGYTKRSKALAQALEAEVIKLGQNSRGLKTKLSSNGLDYFSWLRNTSCPAVLVEGAFLDSSDRLSIDTEEKQKAFGVAYAHAVLNYLGITINPDTMYRVQVGAFKDKNNAEKLAEELRKKGYAAIIK